MSRAFTERGEHDVVKWEVLPIHDGDDITICFESAAGPLRQGIWLATDRGLIVEGQLCPSIYLWYDTAPRRVMLTGKTVSGWLSLYNIWEDDRGVQSQGWSSGMRVEQDGDKLRYRCNDTGFDGAFDRLVFTVRLPPPNGSGP